MVSTPISVIPILGNMYLDCKEALVCERKLQHLINLDILNMHSRTQLNDTIAWNVKVVHYAASIT